MSERHVGLLGATSLIGECLLKQLIQNNWHITAFSRRPITQSHPQIAWKQLDTTNQLRVGTEENNIPFWICAAPVWTLPDYFDLNQLLAHDGLSYYPPPAVSPKTRHPTPANEKLRSN